MTDDATGQVTRLLNAAERGQRISDKLFPLVYDELRQLAHRQMSRTQTGRTLQTTALVHEAYIRLVHDKDRSYKNRGHFVATAALAMRQILVDRARQHRSLKRGGQQQRVQLHEVELEFYGTMPDDELLALDEALTELQQRDPLKSRIVTLRYFGGMTIEETAAALGKSAASVKHHWKFAKAWLYREMNQS